MKKAVIFDIDGVLAKKSPERNYREYDKVHLDSPIESGFDTLYAYANLTDHKIFFITGRKELCRKATVEFLEKHSPSLELVDYKLLMRENSDHRKAPILKKELYEQFIKDKYDVLEAYDDDPDICEMWRSVGITAFEIKREIEEFDV